LLKHNNLMLRSERRERLEAWAASDSPSSHSQCRAAKKYWIVRIWAIAPNYFKYKMFCMARCRTACWTEAFHPEKEGNEHVG
jgi:hypothetical protein